MNCQSSIVHRKLSILLILHSLFFILFSGCGPEKITKPQQTPPLSIQPAIAGVWQTSGEKPWKLTLAADGSITDVVRADGLHFVIAEGSLELQPADNIYAKYVFGPCLWNYDKQANRLDVVLTIDDMLVTTDQAEFKCSLIDEFSGPLSEDGKTWTPEWIMTTKFEPPVADQVAGNGMVTFTKTE